MDTKKYKRYMANVRKDPERLKEWRAKKCQYASIHRKKHPFKKLIRRLFAEKGIRIEPFDLWKIAKKQRLICPISGRKLTVENLSLDHIIPLNAGGTNDISNLQLTTKEVNLAKHVMSQIDFLHLCQDVVNHNKISV